MALLSREDHPKHPPSTWRVERRRHGSRYRYHLILAGDHSSQSFETKREAEAAKNAGFYPDLYEKERRWYAGENVPGWKPSPYAKEGKS